MAYLCKDSAKFSVSRFCFYVSIDIKFTTSRLRQNSIPWLKSKLLSTEFIKFKLKGKVLRCEIPSPEMTTVSLVMPTSYPRCGMFNLLLTLVWALMLKDTVGKTSTLRNTAARSYILQEFINNQSALLHSIYKHCPKITFYL